MEREKQRKNSRKKTEVKYKNKDKKHQNKLGAKMATGHSKCNETKT